MRYALSVCLGEKDAGISVLQRVEKDRNSLEVPDHWLVSTQDVFIQRVYHLRHLEKIDLDYEKIIDRLSDISYKLEMQDRTKLLVDVTVSGNSVVDVMRDERLYPVPIKRVDGGNVVRGDIGYTVPEKDMITSLKVLYQSRRIKMPSKLKHLEEFQNDLLNFSLGLTAEEWREGSKSVLVLSVAQSAWYFGRAYRNNRLIGNQQEVASDWNPLG
ncbi:MAG: hypothetical protein K9M94_12990 [Spirochaetia bacterium]|nr:hypothetical protein [Spirochaetia bacterium]